MSIGRNKSLLTHKYNSIPIPELTTKQQQYIKIIDIQLPFLNHIQMDILQENCILLFLSAFLRHFIRKSRDIRAEMMMIENKFNIGDEARL